MRKKRDQGAGQGERKRRIREDCGLRNRVVLISGVLTVFVLAAVAAVLAVRGHPSHGSRGKDAGEEPEETVLEWVMETAPEAVQRENVFLIDERAVDRETADDSTGSALKDRNVFFAGFVDGSISRESVVKLENLPENGDFLMRYVITDTDSGECVFETGLIPPGQCVLWKPGETLETGTHHLEFLMIPYYVDGAGEYLVLTSGSNAVCYEIR